MLVELLRQAIEARRREASHMHTCIHINDRPRAVVLLCKGLQEGGMEGKTRERREQTL